LLRLWNAYWLGVRARMCRPRDPKTAMRQYGSLIVHPTRLVSTLTPIDYVRYREFEFVMKSISRYSPAPQKVLDIGSPKLLALSLAMSMPEAVVHTLDLLHREVRSASDAAQRLRIGNLVPQVQDARCLGYADSSFDVVVSVSVLEHIAPEHDGDVPASRELGRVLAPRGVAILTVPFWRVYFAEYRIGPVYGRTSSHGEPIFFQRFYDYDRLTRNIIRSSGLDLLYLGFIEERFLSPDPKKRLSQFVNASPTQNLVFGLSFPILSRVFLSHPKPLASCKKPYIACIVLRKP